MVKGFKTLLFVAFLLQLLTLTYAVDAQKIAPVDGVLSLSGSFAEIRSAHFHGGVDFRTGGVIGKPIKAVDDGYVGRVSVSPTGYGKAIYLVHPDGTMSVYAHLDRFESSLQKAVYNEQYRVKQFAVDFMPQDTIFYAKGNVIGLSGNSGSSGGPHLHFEIRDAATNLDLNSSHYIKVHDKIAPEIRGLYLYSVDMSGNESRSKKYSLIRNGNSYTINELRVPEGVFGVGLHVVDRMEGSTGKLGLYEMKLYADDNLVSRYIADTIDLEKGRFVNILGDYEAYSRKETVYRTFGAHWNSVIGCSAEFDGYMGVEQDSVVRVRVELTDYNGNKSHLAFNVRGGMKRKASPNGVIWHIDEYNYARVEECSLSLEAGSLIRSVPVAPKVIVDTLKDRVNYRFVSSEEPLLEPVRVTMRGEYTPKHVLCVVTDKGKVKPLKTEWYKDSLVAKSTILASYCVMQDTVAPKIDYRGKAGGRLLFMIADKHTGLSEMSVSVNGEWTLYDFDAKRNALRVELTEPTFGGGVDTVKVQIKDVVGNIMEKSIHI